MLLMEDVTVVVQATEVRKFLTFSKEKSSKGCRGAIAQSVESTSQVPVWCNFTN